jgi:hypothetical protein
MCINSSPSVSIRNTPSEKNVCATAVVLKSANLRRLAPFFSGLNVGPAALYGHSAMHGPAAHIQRQSQRPEKCHFTPFIAIFFSAENINFFTRDRYVLAGAPITPMGIKTFKISTMCVSYSWSNILYILCIKERDK